jgi:hypothetical protein
MDEIENRYDASEKEKKNIRRPNRQRKHRPPMDIITTLQLYFHCQTGSVDEDDYYM